MTGRRASRRPRATLSRDAYAALLLSEGKPFTFWWSLPVRRGRGTPRRVVYTEPVWYERQLERIEVGTRAATWDDFDAWLWKY